MNSSIGKILFPALNSIAPFVKNTSDDLSAQFNLRNNTAKIENAKRSAEYELEKARNYVKMRIAEV